MTPIRRQRNVKIVATLGPASDTYEMIRALFVDRRRRLPAQHEPWNPRRHRPAARADSPGRGGARPADRHPRRPAGAEAPLRHLRRRPGDARGGRGLPLRPRPGRRRRHPRLPAASGDLPGARGRLDAPRQRRQDPAEGHRALARARASPRWWSAARSRTARASTCPTWCCRSPRSRPRTRRTSSSPATLGVDWLALSFVQRAERRLRGARARRRARRDPLQDREAGRGQRLRRDPRRLRRHHGRPRRPRRRAAGAPRCRRSRSG